MILSHGKLILPDWPDHHRTGQLAIMNGAEKVSIHTYTQHTQEQQLWWAGSLEVPSSLRHIGEVIEVNTITNVGLGIACREGGRG